MFLKEWIISLGSEDTARGTKELFRAVTEYRVLIQTDAPWGQSSQSSTHLQVQQAGGSVQWDDLSLAP